MNIGYNLTVCHQGPFPVSAHAVNSTANRVEETKIKVTFRPQEDGGCGTAGITLRRQEDFELKPSGGGNWTLAIVVAKDVSSVTLQPNHTGQPDNGSTSGTYEAVRYLWSKSPGSHNRDDSTPGNVSVYAEGPDGEGLPAPPFFLPVT